MNRSAIRDAAKQAAVDECERLGSNASRYVIGRIVEAVLAVVEQRPIAPAAPTLDVEHWEL